MDESGNHHSQQTDTRTENQTPPVLTHKQVLKNENRWTQGGEYHTLGYVGGGGWGGIALGEINNVDDRLECSKPPWHVHTCVTILQDLHMYPRT